jgi:hypothetical protein
VGSGFAGNPMVNGDSLDAHIMHNACTTHMHEVCEGSEG